MKNLTLKILRSVAFAFCAVAASFHAQAAQTAAELAPTPQMGFNNWNSTHCRAEFNEAMIRGIADKFIELGLKDAGYTYVNIDDCWANWKRDANGNIQANPVRFPSGIKALADYIHSKGLKFGLYSSAGTWTCEPKEENRGFPGGLGHEKQDAATYASWGVDYLKYDNCPDPGADPGPRIKPQYQAMRDALDKVDRPIVYSICAWSFYEWANTMGNLQRTTTE